MVGSHNLFFALHFLLAILLCIAVIVRIFWISNFIYKLNKDRKLLKRFLDKQEDFRVKKRIQYNYDTIKVRNLFLAFISIIEPLGFLSFVSLCTIYRTRVRTTAISNKVKHISPNCTVDPFIGLAYHEPIFLPLFIVVFSMYILYITSLSMLCKFITQRYIVLPYKRVLYNSMLWLTIQIIVLAFSSTIYILAIGIALFSLFIWIDWCILIRDTRRLAKALKAKLTEIRLFEFNQQRYLSEERGYTGFIFFTKIFLVEIFCYNVVFLTAFILVYFQLIIASTCLLDVLYKINIDFHFNTTFIQHEETLTYMLVFYMLPVMFIITILISTAPAFIYTSTLIGLLCAKRFKKRQYRFTNEELMQKLLSIN